MPIRPAAVVLALAAALASPAAGRRDKAIRACRRSLELDPANANAEAMLKHLEAAR